MFAYIVGESGAKKLLNITNKVNYPIDDIVFQQGGINNGKIKGYTSRKKICSVSFSDSEIKKNGSSVLIFKVKMHWKHIT
jgi:GR25 family glycosyltransferase involved in LPS biosynthesis